MAVAVLKQRGGDCACQNYGSVYMRQTQQTHGVGTLSRDWQYYGWQKSQPKGAGGETRLL